MVFPEFVTPPAQLVLTAVLSYMLGSILFGLPIARLMGLGDLRSMGSGNIGTTNVLRTGNMFAAMATLLLDAGKGAVAVLAASAILGDDAAQVAGVSAVLGHVFPIWLRFKGGKGVATFVGVTLALSFPAGVAVCATWLCFAGASRMGSVGSLAGALLAPVWFWLTGGTTAVLATAIMALLVWIRHADNISRLAKGKEPRMTRVTKLTNSG